MKPWTCTRGGGEFLHTLINIRIKERFLPPPRNENLLSVILTIFKYIYEICKVLILV